MDMTPMIKINKIQLAIVEMASIWTKQLMHVPAGNGGAWRDPVWLKLKRHVFAFCRSFVPLEENTRLRKIQ
jgi:hypothetical protein